MRTTLQINRRWTLDELVAGCGCDTDVDDAEFAADDLAAEVEEADDDNLVPWSGVLVVEGEATGDGRMIEEGALRWEVPMPLRWVREDVQAHEGAIRVGHIATAERVGDEIRATGFLYMDVPETEGLLALLDDTPMGVSIDMDDITFEIRVDRELYEEGIPGADEDGLAEGETDDDGREIVVSVASDEELFVVTDGRIRGATLGDIPAFDRAQIELDGDVPVSLAASVIGQVDLPVTARDREWSGDDARSRVFDLCTDDDGNVDVACVARAFLWRDEDADPQTQQAYKLGFADVVDGDLKIVPAGVAATTGGRGLPAAEGIPDGDRSAIETRICSLYDRIRQEHDDWPDCPYADDDAAADTDEAAGVVAAMIAALPEDDRPFGLEFEQIPHVTLSFLGSGDDYPDGAEEQVAVAGEHVPMDVRVAGVGHLGDEDPPATVLFLNGDDLAAARDAAQVDGQPDQHEPFLAHMTVGYGMPIEDVAHLVGETFRLDRVALVGDGDEVIEVHPQDEAIAASALNVPTRPPKTWFTDPRLDGPTRMTVDDDGRVYGHVALWSSCHTGYSDRCVRPPRSRMSYNYFLTGMVRTEEGEDVPVGRVTVGTTHAGRSLSANDAQWHYEHTGAAVADVACGEDAHGIWVAGALRPGTTDQQVRELLASPPSGDWRPMRGSLEMIAVLAVNVPGFPVIASAHVSDGEMTSLVAGWDPRDLDDDAALPLSDGADDGPDEIDLKIIRQFAASERRRRRARARAAALRVTDAKVARAMATRKG